MSVLTVEAAAAKLGLSPRSLMDKRWRIRVGLHATKVGRRVVFAEADLERLLRRGRETLPASSQEPMG